MKDIVWYWIIIPNSKRIKGYFYNFKDVRNRPFSVKIKKTQIFKNYSVLSYRNQIIINVYIYNMHLYDIEFYVQGLLGYIL